MMPAFGTMPVWGWDVLSWNALAVLVGQGIRMIYAIVRQVLAQRSFALTAGAGTFGIASSLYHELRRVENGKIAGRWDVMGRIAGEFAWRNKNGKL